MMTDDAFKQLMKIYSVQTKLTELREAFKKDDLSENVAGECLQRIKDEMNVIDDKNCIFQPQVNVDSDTMQEVSDQLQKAMSIKSEVCDSSNYQIRMSKGNLDKRVNIIISSTSDKAFEPPKTSLLQVTIESKSETESFSIKHLISDGKALKLNPNELIYSVNAKIHRELKIYVKVMGKDILSSPLI